MKQETTSWQTTGFKTGKRIRVVESVQTGNVLEAFYINNGEWLTADEIELELF